MFRSKSDIDKHVSGLLQSAKTEEKRNSRCFHIAKLYHKIQDYESVQRYVNMYLNTRDDSAAAHKLLGQALEGLGKKQKAISAYNKSLKLEPEQTDLVLKVCELLCDKDVEFDPVLARCWSERASLIFPHSLPVLMLKEKLLMADSTVSSKDLEELLHAELKSRPTDVTVRMKLLKMYAESGRSEMAYNHAFEVESRLAHVNCFAWYQCLHNICKAHNRDHFAKCGWEFYIHWLIALDRMCLLSVTDNMFHFCDMSEAIDCVYSLDQALYSAHQCPVKSDKYGDFLKVMSTQLAYLLGLLLLKKTKKEYTQWKDTKRLVGPLFILAANVPLKLVDQSWTSNLKENLQKVVEFWNHQVQCRQVQAGHLLLSLVKEVNSEKMFLDKVSHFIASDWRKQIFEKLFSSIGAMKPSASFFMTGLDYAKLQLKIPNNNALKSSSFVSSFENTYFGSLHHLVWLGLRSVKKTSLLEMKLTSFHTTRFKSLQFTINNLNNIGVETLNQLDVDSFLYISVFCTALILEEGKSNGYTNEDMPNIMPADVSSPLCTGDQSKWWSSLCTLVNGNNSVPSATNESMSSVRYTLQRGLEVVRGEGLSPILVTALARSFAARGALSNNVEETDGCLKRALHLWQVAYPTLERLASNKSYIYSKQNPLFEFPVKIITPQEAKSLFEEAKFYIGCHYLNTAQFEKAVTELKGIKTPQAVFNLGLVYKRWAEQLINGLSGEEITSEIRCRHVVLATKAREYLLEAKSLLKYDLKNPIFSSDIESQLSEVEDLLSRIEPENGCVQRDVNGASDDSCQSYGSGMSPEVLKVLTSTGQRHVRHHNTSTPHRTHEQKISHFNLSEIIDLLSVQHSTNQLKMQQLLEQGRLLTEKLDMLASEQRTSINGLTSRFNSFESEMRSNISDIKKDLKRPDLYNMFDDDEHADEMLQFPGYSHYYGPTQRVAPNSAAASAAPYLNQYVSPRIDPIFQGFYSQQGALPFSEGQQLPDFLRQQKLSQPILHNTVPTGIPQTLNLPTAIPGPSRVAPPVISSNVLLTTADTLTSGTSPVQPPLSINISTSQRTAVTSSNVPHNFQIPLPSHPKPVLNIEERQIDEETPPPTYDPLPDYKPIVPLPDEVEVRTGEEDEEILFERRAKLYRFVEKMWKERGVGNLKILKNKTTGKIRILMRRDQVHKVCANHFLTSDMELQPKINTEHAWIWVANDYADQEIHAEKFCAKFKTQEDSDEFKTVFDKARDDLLNITKEACSTQSDPSSSAVVSSEPKTVVSSTFTFGFPSYTGSAPTAYSFSSPSFNSSLSAPNNLKALGKETGIFKDLLNPSSEIAKSQEAGEPLDLGKPQEDKKSVEADKTQVVEKPSSSNQSPKVGGLSFTLAPSKLNVSENSKENVESVKLQGVENPSKQTHPARVGGFIFSQGAPKFKAPETSIDETVKTSKEPNPFAKMNLGVSVEQPKDLFSSFSNISGQKTSDLPNPFAINRSKLTNESSSDSRKNNKSEPVQEQIDNSNSHVSKDEADADDFIPNATFQPVIPLPDLITVKTGEENEEVIYEDRAHLYRFCKETRQWKERGTGQMKILKHRESGVYRLLMRREQVLKVCCNHRITKDISLKPLSSSDRAFSWAAKDHSEDPPTDELFSLKFKNTEQAFRFKEAFEKAKDCVQNSSHSVPKVNESKQPPLSSLVKKPSGSWDCENCYVQNKADSNNCAACSTPKVKGSSTSSALPHQAKIISQSSNKVDSQLPLAELLKPKPGSWECQGCYIKSSADVDKCPSCGTNKPGTVAKTYEQSKVNIPFTFGTTNSTNSDNKVDSQLTLTELLKPKPGSWECRECYIQSPANVDTCPSCGTKKPGAVAKNSEPSKVNAPFTFGIPNSSADNSQNKFLGFCDPSTVPSSFVAPKIEASSKVSSGNSKPQDTMGIPSIPGAFTFGSGSGFNFNATATKPSDSTTSTLPISSSGKEGFIFTPTPPKSTNSDFKFGSTTFQFAMSRTHNVPASPGNTSQHDESGYDPEEEEEENFVQFMPVVPLPDKVDVLTGEENEDLLYSHRAKLFRYEESSKEWKERGLGDVKILRHKETGKIRFLMRREPVMKVCLNHFLTPEITLREKDEKSWMWYAIDFSEGTQSNEKFAIRFKNSDIAQVFKDEVEKAKLLLSEKSSDAVIKHGEEVSKEDLTEGSNSGSENDVVFVSEENAPPELVEKALSLHLPPNYYLYLNKPDCSGCKGCEPQSEEENEKPKEEEKPSLFNKHIFGGSQLSSSFGNSKIDPNSASFSFAQAFTSPNGKSSNSSNSSQQKLFFSDANVFSSPTLQKTIFGSVNQEGPAFLSGASSMQSFSNLSQTTTSFGHSGENFKWEGAGQPVFGGKHNKEINSSSTTSQQQVSHSEKAKVSSKKDPDTENIAK